MRSGETTEATVLPRKNPKSTETALADPQFFAICAFLCGGKNLGCAFCERKAQDSETSDPPSLRLLVGKDWPSSDKPANCSCCFYERI